MEKKRINKYIADSGFCSRRRADKLIEEGKVTVNGKRAGLGDQVSEHDTVMADGSLIEKREHDEFIAFNNPLGVISTADENSTDTVFDYLPPKLGRLFYIGRLDVKSTGLMIFTNNGDVANEIAHARGDHEKEYAVTVDKKITRKFLDLMRSGVLIEGGMTQPARAKRVSDTRFELVITEGRNRQIRKMCEALGYRVKKLKRTRVGSVKLGDLGEGNWRQLTKKERRNLIRPAGSSHADPRG